MPNAPGRRELAALGLLDENGNRRRNGNEIATDPRGVRGRAGARRNERAAARTARVAIATQRQETRRTRAQRRRLPLPPPSGDGGGNSSGHSERARDGGRNGDDGGVAPPENGAGELVRRPPPPLPPEIWHIIVAFATPLERLNWIFALRHALDLREIALALLQVYTEARIRWYRNLYDNAPEPRSLISVAIEHGFISGQVGWIIEETQTIMDMPQHAGNILSAVNGQWGRRPSQYYPPLFDALAMGRGCVVRRLITNMGVNVQHAAHAMTPLEYIVRVVESLRRSLSGGPQIRAIQTSLSSYVDFNQVPGIAVPDFRNLVTAAWLSNHTELLDRLDTNAIGQARTTPVAFPFGQRLLRTTLHAGMTRFTMAVLSYLVASLPADVVDWNVHATLCRILEATTSPNASQSDEVVGVIRWFGQRWIFASGAAIQDARINGLVRNADALEEQQRNQNG